MPSARISSLVLAATATALAACASAPNEPLLTAAAAGAGPFPETWIDGTSASEPPIQLHAYDPDTWILRQSLRTNFEAPFLYLLIGSERALLLDTGAGGIDLAGAVDRVLAERGVPELPLVAAHLHAHGDHVAGDAQLAARPGTTVVGKSPEDVARFFGIEGWPEGTAELDLGGRVLDVIAIPGHEPAHIAVYDRRTRILLTGDSLYPGRLYVDVGGGLAAWREFRRSIGRLVAFTETRPVTHVLGTHIELGSEPGVEYAMGSRVHPRERRLELGREHLLELHAALARLGDAPATDRHRDFVIRPIRF